VLGLSGSDKAKSTNPVLRAAIMEVVHNQLRDSTPPEVRATLDRLLDEGHTREQAVELIACVVSSEIFDILKQGQPYNESRYVDALQKLPQLPWEEA
jgi:peroxiredoxin family protein